jgi:membrane protein YdbS with pleckstrin-like domain
VGRLLCHRMYNLFRTVCERFLRIPGDPEPPPGDESTTRVFRASPKYFKYLLVVWSLQTAVFLLPILAVAVVMLVVAFTVRKQNSSGVAIIVGTLLLGALTVQRLIKLAVLRLEYEKRWYVVTDRSLRVREGVIEVQEMTITFANIQNISISQGPIQRLLGIADLRVDTAGGGGGDGGGHSGHPGHDLHTAWFRGIDNADEVRSLIQHRLRHLKDSGLGDQEELTENISTTPPADFVNALREVYREASALRTAVSRS